MSMSKRKPSAESVKAHREWSSLVDDLNEIESTDRGRRLIHGPENPGMSAEVKAQKAKIEARLKELDLSAGLDFPL